jgi:hypothetical protein
VTREECPECHQPLPESRPINPHDVLEPILRRVAMVAAAIVAIALGASEQLFLASVLIAGALVMWLYWRAEIKQPRCSRCNQVLTHRTNAI